MYQYAWKLLLTFKEALAVPFWDSRRLAYLERPNGVGNSSWNLEEAYCIFLDDK